MNKTTIVSMFLITERQTIVYENVCTLCVLYVCVHVSPAIFDRKAPAVYGPCPRSETQNSHDEGPDELIGGIAHWTFVSQQPRLVHKTLNVLQSQKAKGHVVIAHRGVSAGLAL